MTEKTSILVIDDEPDNFDVIEALLSSQDYTLHYAASGQGIDTTLNATHPDLILLDVMMPEINGMAVCQQVKAMTQWQAVPIIMVTALGTKEDLSRCLEAGADDFISKPINSMELRARVKSMLRIKQQYDRIKNLCSLQENTIELLERNLSELCGNLVTTLPHELNTPLNGVMGLLELLTHEYQNMDADEIRNLLSMAQASAQRLENLTKRFLKYAQIELSSNDPKKSEAALNQINISTRLFLESTLKAKAKKAHRLNDVAWQLEDMEVFMSRHDFMFMIDELLENAFKFSQAGTPIQVSSHLKEGKFHLSISDQGRGIAQERLAQIDAFIQHERKHYGQQGLGLGLKIVSKIIEIHGGTFLISSVHHQGTTVFVELPAIQM